MVRLSALGPRFRNRPLTLDLFAAGDSSEAETQTILEQLKQSPEAQRAKVLETWFAAQVALLLGLDLSTFDVNKPLTWLGLDSLMAVDLKKAFDDHLGTDVPHALIQSGPSVAELSLKVVAMVDVNAILDGATASESGSEGGTFGALTALRAGDTASPVDLAESAMGSSRVASEPGPTTAEDDESVPPAVVAALVGVLGLLTVGGLWYLFG